MESGSKILVVDDNQKNLEIVSRYLKDVGYKIALAEDGESALLTLNSDRFDLILLDIMMPGLDGFQVCAKIRENKGYDTVPIIFLTAKIEKEDVLRGFELGGQDYVTKPFDSRELLARVNTQLELKRNRDQLMEINARLDEKVKERTLQLEKTNKKLLELDEAKINFLRIISHEIRTPLNGVKGFAGFLKVQNESENLLKYFELLEKSVERLEDFSKLAMNITQLQLNKYDLRLTDINVNDIFNIILNELNDQITVKGLKINKADLNNERIIVGDMRLVPKAIKIIMENAIKHTVDNSSIDIFYSQNNDFYVFSVKDKGAGFSPELLEGELKLFLTGENHINLNMGLNLPFTNMIMLAHNGKLVLKNHEDGGLAELYFPIASKNSYMY